MSRPLPPFIRHLGEAKHRTRQLRLATERADAAAIAVAGLTGDDAALRMAIAAVREQLALLETLAARWASERDAGTGPRRRDGVREEIGAWLGRTPPRDAP